MLRCFDSYNSLMYVQMVPIIPSFYSFPNCELGFTTMNTLGDEARN
jgi:hypothetical protein